MQYKRLKLDINGFLLIDKSHGVSSNQIVSKIKFLFSPKKVGHTGTLDPMATGLLPICLGEATKFSRFLLNADKTYEALIKLGYKSSTGDSEGKIVKQSIENIPSLTVIKKVLLKFRGQIDQIPPMYSALKHKGKPLYLYARKGVEIKRTKRKVTIYAIEILDFYEDKLKLKIKCSKGTYIRTLAEDIGAQLNIGGYLLDLVRTDIGHLNIKKALKIEEIEKLKNENKKEILMPMEALLSDFKKIKLNIKEENDLKDGKIINKIKKLSGQYRLFGKGNKFIGLGEVDEKENLKVLRLISQMDK
ncbi:MAG: tRNA pseudouridine(55) synthase TruB [Nitrosomonadales bacterium]|nr:tRNA pseudouridine(55) synthase TruB [Nitrosomonadales bacterium]MAS00245.1 tRNA pseudouridine(55) synthase TruB [Nitrosomonadales bacterium]|tara:strand:- start:3077 stop:3985 length:909 start_codon:yes stop_codon:yes gene_type:complete